MLENFVSKSMKTQVGRSSKLLYVGLLLNLIIITQIIFTLIAHQLII